MTTVPKELLTQWRAAMLEACGNRCNVEYNPCQFREAANSMQAAIDQPDPGPVRVYLVATGEIHEGEETYTRHDVRPPLCDAEVLFTRPAPAKPDVKESLTTNMQAAPDKPLTDEQIGAAITAWFNGDHQQTFLKRMRNAIDAAHNIGVKP